MRSALDRRLEGQYTMDKSLYDISWHDSSSEGVKHTMRADDLMYLPLTTPTFHIVLSLAPGKRHGYAILEDVEALSRREVGPSTSTLYAALHRLLGQGLFERTLGPTGSSRAKNGERSSALWLIGS
jgi:hypothetical protein